VTEAGLAYVKVHGRLRSVRPEAAAEDEIAGHFMPLATGNATCASFDMLGPNTAKDSAQALRTRLTICPLLLCVSMTSRLSFRPAMPPLALISSRAISKQRRHSTAALA